jgi:hypothetical protein
LTVEETFRIEPAHAVSSKSRRRGMAAGPLIHDLTEGAHPEVSKQSEIVKGFRSNFWSGGKRRCGTGGRIFWISRTGTAANWSASEARYSFRPAHGESTHGGGW